MAVQHPTLTGMTEFNGSRCHINDERMSFENNTMLIPMPGDGDASGTASGDALHSAVFGPTRSITLTGYYTGTSTQILAFLQEMDDWQNDGNPVAKNYVNYVGKTYEGTFLPLNFAYNFSTDSVLIVDFTITIVEGQKIS